jgi:hypothetical protein
MANRTPTYAPSDATQVLDNVGTKVALSIVDRNNNINLPIYVYQGEYWVAGTPNQAYAIGVASRIRGRRTLATVSVDGINVLTGENANVLQRGYVLSPSIGYSIAGWRKSEAEIAAFKFGEPLASYAAQTDRPSNIGVIGVAVFPEQRQLPPPPPVLAPLPPPPAIQADAAMNVAKKNHAIRAESSQYGRAASVAPAPALGTQHGERETSYSHVTEFNRESNTPTELIQLRYDSVSNLVARGVLRWLPQAPVPVPRPVMVPTAFPSGDNGYVPDPPRYHR